MSVINQVKKDRLVAMRDGHKETAATLTTLYSEAAKVGFDDGKRETTDQEFYAVAKKFIKNINETLAVMSDNTMSSRMTINKLCAEKVLIETYLPKQMSDDEIKSVMASHILEVEGVNVGQLMKFMSMNYKNQFDGKAASKIAAELLK